MKYFTASEYLMIDIANNYGLDKLNWEDRIKFVKDNEPELENMSKPANPCLYYTAVQAYRDYQQGKAIGYPISLDSTSSGLQWLAVLTGDIAAAKLCNVYNTGKREDSYTIIYNKFKELAGESHYKRDNIKQAIMTSLYGSKKVPKDLFGEQYYIFENLMGVLAPKCWELNKYLLDNWDSSVDEYNWVMPDNFHVTMEVEDKVKDTFTFLGTKEEFHHYEKRPISKGKALGANLTHSVDSFALREIVTRCSISIKRKTELIDLLDSDHSVNKDDPEYHLISDLIKHYRTSGILSSRVLLHLNTSTIGLFKSKELDELSHLITTLPKKPFKIITIHDSFRVHPNYGNDIREQYIFVMSKIAKSNLLTTLLQSIFGPDISYQKEYLDLDKDILESEYAIC